MTAYNHESDKNIARQSDNNERRDEHLCAGSQKRGKDALRELTSSGVTRRLKA